MPFTNTPNMGLPVPTVSSQPGPQFATDVNQALNVLDGHTHGPGSGVPIGSQGINLQSDLSFNIYNATNLRSVRFISTTASSGTDIGCVYVKGVDLFYTDLNANVIRITQNGGLASTAIFVGLVSTTAIISANGVPASSGFIRMVNNTDFLSWRNAANNADNRIYFDTSDNFNIVGGGIVGEGQGSVPLKVDAAAGNVGEYLTYYATTGSVIASSTPTTYGNFGSINLSVGDWDISAGMTFDVNSNVTSFPYPFFQVYAGLSQYSRNPATSTASDDMIPSINLNRILTSSALAPLAVLAKQNMFVPTYRLSTSAPATIYFKVATANLDFSAANQTTPYIRMFDVFMRARRVR